MRTIKHWTIKVTWSDGKEEFLNDIPYFKNVEYYLDQLQEEMCDEDEVDEN